MSETYQPGKNLTIDEGVCPFRGRVHFKVYMKNKPNKYGMKLYILSDPLNGYTLKFEIYSGKNDTDNSITALFDRLLSEYYYKGHTVYMDRFYTSPTVLKSLWEKNTKNMSNRRGLPKEIVKEKLKKGEMTFARQGPLICIKWKDTRDVLMLSTVHNADMTPVTVRSKIGPIEKFKPLAIVDYNLNKTGVDHGDQMVSYYPFQRKTLKWWKKIIPSTPSKKNPRRVCKVCADKGKYMNGIRGRKETPYCCKICDVSLCVDQCFETYHTKQKYWL
ncbi:hypothetical protein AGLY_011975 [Aphis glycines]|uniref:Uncharacterized protein n=1 Tax=Aphis glycines TaxID=307491 RepID=A0A6G0TAL0_APHGL|nr:hypothetical protein AGLY_011975 [Aphis glycines]